jgi:hypothetical protein
MLLSQGSLLIFLWNNKRVYKGGSKFYFKNFYWLKKYW